LADEEIRGYAMLQFLGLPAISTRVIGLAPRKIDKRTFETVLCRGDLIERSFGFERLRIAQACIDLSRINNGGIALLDSYREDSISRSLGRLIEARVQDGALVGVIAFHQTPDGEEAAKLIDDESSKFNISVAYAADQIEIYDASNALVDPNDTERASEPGIAFEVTAWQIAALGLIRSDESDHSAQDRAYHGPVAPDVARVFERMAERHMAAIATDQRLASRVVKPEINVSIFNGHDHRRDVVAATRARLAAAQKLIECGNDGWRDVAMPARDMIFYGRPEAL
jgi:hypothetical protein